MAGGWGWLLLLAALIGALAAYLVLPFAVKLLLARRLDTLIARSGAACLTFDDGPDPRSTPAILEALEAAGVRATFFALGTQLAAHPELSRRLVAAGHELAEHGFAHRHAWRTGPVAYVRDLIRGGNTVARLRPAAAARLFRPAYGELNLLTLLYLALGRRRLVMWNLNPRDFAAATAADVALNVARELRPGSVVLLHDARADVSTDPQVTVEAVRLILAEARRRNLRLIPVGTALRSA